MQISSESQLREYLNLKFGQVLESTMNELLDKLKDFIEEEVYSYDNQWYERTYEFRDSWEAEKPKMLRTMIESTIGQNIDLMHYNYYEWQHGSQVKGWGSSISHLADIINYGNIGTIFGFPDIGARPFWGKFELYCDANFNKIFQKNAKAQGLNGIMT